MPRFFIDTSDEERFVEDEDGLDFDCLEAAKAAVIEALPDMARDTLRAGDAHAFVAIVRDSERHPLLRVSLSLQVMSLDRSGHAIRI